MCERELEMFGLGWISFTNIFKTRGIVRINVYLPENVPIHLRNNINRFEKKLFHNKIQSRTSHSNLARRSRKNLFETNS